jgi:dGTPase
MRWVHESIRRLVSRMVEDLISQTSRNIRGIASVEEVRSAGKSLATFSKEMQQAHRVLRAFLMERMYRHYKVNRMTSKARRVVQDLFTMLHAEPECLPTHWQSIAGKAGSQQAARAVADFIAGMTDRFALEEHRRLFDLSMVNE